MNKLNLTALSLLLATALGIFTSNLCAQSLVYEREFTLVGEEHNTLRIELTANGTLIVDRPAFMTNSGRHEKSIDRSVYSQMADQLSVQSEGNPQLNMELQQQAMQEMRYISDPEISRFYRLDERGRKVDSVSGISLEARARVYPNVQSLISLRELEQKWYRLMQMAVSPENHQ